MEESKNPADQATIDQKALDEAIASLPQDLRESILKMIDSTVKSKVEAQLKI